MMSLRSRILASIVVVIVLTVVITVGVGYYTTQARLGVFVDQIGDDEAIQLARNLSREYTAAGGWGDGRQTAVRGGLHLRRTVLAGSDQKTATKGTSSSCTETRFESSSLTSTGVW